jgi:hypothetical protein
LSKISLSGNASGTGTFTIASPSGNTDRTLDLPDNSGTVVSTGSTAVVTQAMLATAVLPLGVGQTWQDVTASRAVSTTYTNSTGRPIMVVALATNATNGSVVLDISVTGTATVSSSVPFGSGPGYRSSATAVIPNGQTYLFNMYGSGSPSLFQVVELR